ncbi:MAG: universal stress protein [Syntrophobacteraceae bacterium]
MRRLKEILVALDGSSASFHALQESIRLARWAKGRVTAIAVAPSFEGDLSLVGVKNPKDAIEGPSGEILSKAFGMAASAGMEIGVIWEEGAIEERIACRAREGRFDVIVLGRESHRPLRHLFSCTMPVKLASRAPRDILVIPDASEVSWERSFYLDWLAEPDLETFSRSLELCDAYDSLLLSARLDFSKSRDAGLIVYEPIPSLSGSGGKPKSRRSAPRSMPREVSRQPAPTRDLAKAVGLMLADERVGMFFLPFRAVSGIGGWVTRRFLDRLILESPCPVMILNP